MGSVGGLIIGMTLIYLGITGKIEGIRQALTLESGVKEVYTDVDGWRYFMGGAIVMLPCFYLENQNPAWAWKYTLLIFTVLIAFHYAELETFMNFVGPELEKK